MTELVKPTLGDVKHIIANLRDEDWHEAAAMLFEEMSRDAFAEHVFARCAFAMVARKDGEPIAVIGGLPTWSRVWNVWLLATPRFSEVKILVTRYAKRTIIPVLFGVEVNAHMMFTYSISWRSKSKAWLEALGGVKNHTVTGFGRNGEDFDFYCLRRDDA